MNNPFIKITDIETLEALIERSKKQPIVIFKHSTACSISAGAFREMSQFKGEVALVEVQNARQVSGEIAKRTGVTHESPQVIVLRHGKAVWDGSHWEVNSDVIAAAVRAAE
jgi:bacillithiol system protein YtxJ